MKKFFCLLPLIFFTFQLLQAQPDHDSCAIRFESNARNFKEVIFYAIPFHNQHKKPERICWNFGDGTDTCITYNPDASSNYSVMHRYLQAGRYTVCVKVLYQGGCESHSCNTIQAGESSSCDAGFDIVNFPDRPLLKKLVALPAASKKPLRICWNFGDGTDTCINYASNYNGNYSVEHMYKEPGRHYEACMLVEYEGNCTARTCKEIGIAPAEECRADFEKIKEQENAPGATIFRALPWHRNGKKPAFICWKFGDGQDTCIRYPENYTGPYTVAHRYNSSRQYEVCVSITFRGGCESKRCREISIEVPPTACALSFANRNVDQYLVTQIFYITTGSDKKKEQVCWNFGDGTYACTDDPAAVNKEQRHTFPGPGTYHVCVKVLFAGGCRADYCKDILVQNQPGLCGGYLNDSLVKGLTYQFHGQAIKPNSTYTWSFGDGSHASGQDARHTFDRQGTYEVCLVISSNDGCESRICKKMTVEERRERILEIAPNPVIEILHIYFWSNRNEPVMIKIIDASGAVVRAIQQRAVTGVNQWNMNLGGLKTGLYTVLVQSVNQQASQQFFKQ